MCMTTPTTQTQDSETLVWAEQTWRDLGRQRYDSCPLRISQTSSHPDGLEDHDRVSVMSYDKDIREL